MLREQSNECWKFVDQWSFARHSAECVNVTDINALILAMGRNAQACGYCMWRLGKHIRIANVHSDTIVWHFITIHCFCMVIDTIVNEIRDAVCFGATVFCKNTTQCFHIYIHVIVL